MEGAAQVRRPVAGWRDRHLSPKDPAVTLTGAVSVILFGYR